MSLVVIDTVILQKANAPLQSTHRPDSKFAKRLNLLMSIQANKVTPLISKRLLEEYKRQVANPRNDFVRAFIALISSPGKSKINWCGWTGSRRSAAARCRFPREDYHLLRTAIRDDQETAILTEEHRILITDNCIHREFQVHASDPTE